MVLKYYLILFSLLTVAGLSAESQPIFPEFLKNVDTIAIVFPATFF